MRGACMEVLAWLASQRVAHKEEGGEKGGKGGKEGRGRKRTDSPSNIPWTAETPQTDSDRMWVGLAEEVEGIGQREHKKGQRRTRRRREEGDEGGKRNSSAKKKKTPFPPCSSLRWHERTVRDWIALLVEKRILLVQHATDVKERLGRGREEGISAILGDHRKACPPFHRHLVCWRLWKHTSLATPTHLPPLPLPLASQRLVRCSVHWRK